MKTANSTRCRGLLYSVGAGLLGLVVLSAGGTLSARSPQPDAAQVVRLSDLPAEARRTLALIRQGGAYPYCRDGAVCMNREGRLPAVARGTHREYTVPTPGRSARDGRRIVAADIDRFWYSDNHYRSFRRVIA